MLSVIRKYSGSWMIKAILIAVAVTFFGGWGILSLFRRGFEGDEYVAIVNGEKIPTERMEKSYRNLEQRFRERLGGQFSDELASRLHLKQQALNFLINRELILDEAEKLKLEVTEAELRDSLAQFPAFLDSDGKFSPSRYQQVLRFQRMTPEEFEANQLIALRISKFEHLVKDSVPLSEQEVYSEFVRQNEKSDLRYLRIGPAEGARRARVTPAEVEQYYRDHQADYQNPARRRARFLVFDPEKFQDQVKDLSSPGAAEDRANRLAYEAAQQAARELKPGENLAAVAQRAGLSLQETPLLAAGLPVAGSAELAGRMFSQNPREISPVISSEGKYFLLEVLEIIPASPRPLKEVAAGILDQLKQEKGKTEALTLAAEALAELKKNRDLEKTARRFGLRAEDTGWFNRGDKSIPGIGSNPEIFEAAFTLTREKPLGEKVFPQDGSYYLIALNRRETADPKKFQEEKAELRKKLRQMKQEVAFQGYLLNLREQADLKINFELIGESDPEKTAPENPL